MKKRKNILLVLTAVVLTLISCKKNPIDEQLVSERDFNKGTNVNQTMAGVIKSSSSGWSGNFIYTWNNKPIKVWYYNPPGGAANVPIMILMHGNGRNANGYRNAMRNAAKAHNHKFLLIVPELDITNFPGSRTYHQGNVLTSNGQPINESEWTFSMIEPLFDYVKADVGSQQQGYVLYGFSAGAQFVHRFMMHKPTNRSTVAIAAAAGTYAVPDWNINYPYGLKKTVVTQAMLTQALAKKMIILVGSNDNDPNASDLTRNTTVDAQGITRVERAWNFFKKSKEKAVGIGTTFNWEFAMVPGVNHSQGNIAGPVADRIFGSSAVQLALAQARLDRPGYNGSANMLNVIDGNVYSRNQARTNTNTQAKVDFGLWNSSSTAFNIILPTDNDRLQAFSSGTVIVNEWQNKNNGELVRLPANAVNQHWFNSTVRNDDVVAAFDWAKTLASGLNVPDHGPGKSVRKIVPGDLIFLKSTTRNFYMMGIAAQTQTGGEGYLDIDYKRAVLP